MTTYGDMTLNAGGSGKYDFCRGTIKGAVSGNKLTGTWTQVANCGNTSEQSGPFAFTMDVGGKSFRGSWGYASDGGPTRGTWNGTCKEGPCLQNGTQPATTTKPTITIPKTVTTRGLWAAEEVVTIKSTQLYRIGGRPRALYRKVSYVMSSVGLYTHTQTGEKVKDVVSGKLTIKTLYHRFGPFGKPPAPLTLQRTQTFKVTGGTPSGSRSVELAFGLELDSFVLCPRGWQINVDLRDNFHGYDHFFATIWRRNRLCENGGRVVQVGDEHETVKRVSVVVRARK